jgi:TPR repeat protein
MALSLTKIETFKTISRPTSELCRNWQSRFRVWLRKECQEAQLSYIRSRAEKGDAANEYRLGLIYELGQYGLRSDEQAFKWFLRAAFQGMVGAQSKVSEFYQTGKGVPRNDEEAFKWCRKAAEQGQTPCQTRLSQMYHDGVGVERNLLEAKKWAGKAAQCVQPAKV